MMGARSRVMTAKKGFSVQVISRRHNVSETGVARAYTNDSANTERLLHIVITHRFETYSSYPSPKLHYHHFLTLSSPSNTSTKERSNPVVHTNDDRSLGSQRKIWYFVHLHGAGAVVVVEEGLLLLRQQQQQQVAKQQQQ